MTYSLFPIPEIYIGFAGFFGGLFVALGGAAKDTKWEGFSRRKFIRSPIIALIWAFVLSMAFKFDEWIILMLCVVAMERLTVEVWKIGIRRTKPSKFNQPERDKGWL